MSDTPPTYYQLNREKRIAYSRTYYQKNKIIINKKNREKAREKTKAKSDAPKATKV